MGADCGWSNFFGKPVATATLSFADQPAATIGDAVVGAAHKY
jgi:hypothetical protein